MSRIISDDGYVRLKPDVYDKFLPVTRGKLYKVLHTIDGLITILTDDKKEMTLKMELFESVDEEDCRLEQRFQRW